jgi:hypothetical protein
LNDDERAALQGQVASRFAVIDGGRAENDPPLRMVFADDLGDEDDVKTWIVDDLFGVGESSCVYGLPGGGKSVWIGDGACHVATGRRWFGYDVRQRVVLYIAAERSNLVKRRLRAWRKRNEVHTLPIVVFDGVFDFVHGTAYADAIVRRSAEIEDRHGLPVGWIIIDTKSQVMAGSNPNDDAEVMALVKSGRVLQEGFAGAHVTYVDHVPHTAPDRMKGSGALAGAVDGSLLVRKEGKQHQVTIGSKPPNDGPDELNLTFRLDSVTLGRDDRGKWTTAPVVVPDMPDLEPAWTRPKPVQLNIGGQKVMSAFGRLLDDGKAFTLPIAIPGVPPGHQGVSLGELKMLAVQMGIFPNPRPPETEPKELATWKASARTAWERGIKEAETKGLLRQEAGFVWEPYSRTSFGGAGDAPRSNP